MEMNVENGWELFEIHDPICDTDWVAVRADTHMTAEQVKARYRRELPENDNADEYGTPARVSPLGKWRRAMRRLEWNGDPTELVIIGSTVQ